MEEGFRPLSGNYISKYEVINRVIEWLTEFPSPLGELHFQIPSLEPLANTALTTAFAGQKVFL